MSLHRYLAHLAQADCVILPLHDDAFNRCKSAVRALDAAAVGVPCIVSDVGDLPNVVRHGHTGLVAETDADWIAGLRHMAASSEMVAQFGLAARRDIETRWSASDAPHIIDPEMLQWIEG